MRTLAVLIVLGALAAPAAAQRNTSPGPLCAQRHDAPPPIVDLYSFGIGPLVFEKFGHSMLCLTYPTQPTICFNYGITDFSNPPKVIWGFLRSKAKFWVDGEDLHSMLAFYGDEDATKFAVIPETVTPRDGCLLRTRGGRCDDPRYGEDRTIWRQRLPLSAEQARTIADRLCHDIQPENRYYTYHHFRDNCTTRLRDMLDEVVGGKLSAGMKDKRWPISFREFGRRGLAEYTPLVAMSDFIGGRNLDYRPTYWEAMFHPDILRQMVSEQLGVEAEVIYQRRGPPFEDEPAPARPWILLAALLLTAPLALARWRGKREAAARVLAIVPIVVIGWVLWSMFALISIDWIRWNEVLLLYPPTDAVLFFLGPARRRRYAQARLIGIALVTLLAAIGVFRQPVWIPAIVAFLPMALLAFDWPRPAAARAKVSATTPAAG